MTVSSVLTPGAGGGLAACACPGVLSSTLGPACGAGRARSSSPPTPRRCARRLEYFWVWSTCNRNVLRMDPRGKESYMLKTSTLRSDHIKAIFPPHNVLLQIASQQVFMQYREDASNLLPLQATGAHSRHRPCCTLGCLWQWKSQPDCQDTHSRSILQDASTYQEGEVLVHGHLLAGIQLALPLVHQHPLCLLPELHHLHAVVHVSPQVRDVDMTLLACVQESWQHCQLAINQGCSVMLLDIWHIWDSQLHVVKCGMWHRPPCQ